MRIIVGANETEQTNTVANMLAALKFERPEIELVHVLERLGDTMIGAQAEAELDLIAKVMKLQEDEAQQKLHSAEEAAKKAGFTAKRTLLTGFLANRLISYSKESQADLLALGSSNKSRLEGLMIGSLGRKAVIGADSSVLIAKQKVDAAKPLTVVLATDHSEFANRCMEQFRSWQPGGIGKMIVVTVYPRQLIKTMNAIMGHFKADVESWTHRELDRSNRELIESMAPLKCSFSSRIETGNVSDTLARVMKEESADLLVLGAQGHGFIERMKIGSVSLDQAIGRDYSVLIVR